MSWEASWMSEDKTRNWPVAYYVATHKRDLLPLLLAGHGVLAAVWALVKEYPIYDWLPCANWDLPCPLQSEFDAVLHGPWYVCRLPQLMESPRSLALFLKMLPAQVLSWLQRSLKLSFREELVGGIPPRFWQIACKYVENRALLQQLAEAIATRATPNRVFPRQWWEDRVCVAQVGLKLPPLLQLRLKLLDKADNSDFVNLVRKELCERKTVWPGVKTVAMAPPSGAGRWFVPVTFDLKRLRQSARCRRCRGVHKGKLACVWVRTTSPCLRCGDAPGAIAARAAMRVQSLDRWLLAEGLGCLSRGGSPRQDQALYTLLSRQLTRLKPLAGLASENPTNTGVEGLGDGLASENPTTTGVEGLGDGNV
eukprot:g2972.t1